MTPGRPLTPSRAFLALQSDRNSTQATVTMLRELDAAFPGKGFADVAARLTGGAAPAVRAVVLAAIDDERPAARLRREGLELLAEFDAAGGNRDAAAKVAKRHSNDPLQREIMAQRIRRLDRGRRKVSSARLPE